MDYITLGQSGITVSRLAFGTLTMGPLQRNLPVDEGAPVIREALERGITFVDTAQSYQTYAHIRKALDGFAGHVVISSKSNKTDYNGMAQAVEEARRELGRDVIDIFLMHAVAGSRDLEERSKGAWQCLLKMKAKGIVKAVGLSTHNIDTMETVTEWPELDIIHPIFNKINFGLINKSEKNPEEVVRAAYERGIGIFAMKPLAGGHLYRDVESALRYALDFPYMHAVAVGMVKREELSVNLKYYYGEPVTEEELQSAASNKRMFVTIYCKGCGKCIEACEHGAIEMKDEKAFIDYSRCILCGYCRKSCKNGLIRLI